jgi:CelD/BcsL family acetyltransferase involved in cellulose biosynthesis
LGSLIEHRDQWDCVTFRNVPTQLIDREALEPLATRFGLKLHCEPGWTSAYVSINSSFDEYLHNRFGKQRLRGIEQKVRQLSARPGYRLDDYQTPEAMQHAIAQAFAVSAASWKKRIGSDMSGANDMRQFYQEISIRLAPSHQIRVWISSLDTIPLALHYALVSQDAIYLLINDFNEEHRRLSPGTVLLYQVLQTLHQERSVRRFHFSGDFYDYKSHWATGLERHLTFRLYHKGLLSTALWYGKTTLGPSLRALRTTTFPTRH